MSTAHTSHNGSQIHDLLSEDRKDDIVEPCLNVRGEGVDLVTARVALRALRLRARCRAVLKSTLVKRILE